MARGTNFLSALLRQGASVLASTPRELPPEVDDPEPVPAARRIGAVAATKVEAPSDPLMVRATRYAVLLPLGYRVFVLVIMWVWFGVAFGLAAAPMVTVVAWIGILGGLLSFVAVLRVPDPSGRLTRVLLVADLVSSVAASVLISLTAPVQLYWAAGWVSMVYLTGTVALWTMVRGLPAGLSLAGLGVAVQIGMLWRLPRTSSISFAGVVREAGLLLASAVIAIGTLVLIGIATRLALAIGMRLGQTSERARTERMLHDTVLQALEAIAMTSGCDEADSRGQLARVRNAARAQATELRRGLSENSAPDGLAAELAALATEMARDGLRAELAISDIGDDRLSEVRRLAVRDAAREAMRNTIKHSGTREVVVRMEERDGGVAVVTRDHGAGYDENARPPGFGVSESMKARLSEVGGWCRIESSPGRGTRVTLWVPQ
ncbi:MAG TPA: ATP-binding protein [Amycolatopsis sp.]|uniref:sensor histidine kinase n=1 Tax=Amycolatopsis sp. TaxID=37632 RepID=UPI002B4965D1|nr:ATP-binding protein [Amycolatopsis sp.]HKS49016.1 ATP-binding protein [Amycolatopsis sp.]